ncbi:mRNA surveillance protein pelota [Thermogladius sp.]|uniref:mRNA surveillance protein pelota n=1 Tax=Thermogladius sp. TaxID=2023064 RepID=UPI003D14407C
MKILEADEKKGIYKILVEDEEDLWALRNILREGDLVEAVTTREVKPGEGGESRRFPMVLRVRVKDVEFQPFTDRLRIRGVVVEGPDKFGVVGKHHTLSIKPGDVVVFVEKELDDFSRKFLETYSRKRRILVVALDYDEVCISLVSEQGVRVVREYYTNLPGKDAVEEYEESVRRMIEQVVEEVLEYSRSLRVDGVIVGSPGFLKDEVIARLKSRGLDKPLFADSVSYGGCKGVDEILRRGGEKNVVRELNITMAVKYFEEFKETVTRDPEQVAYGLENVAKAVELNAVRVLLVSSRLLWSGGEGVDPNAVVLEAFKKRAEVYIVPPDSNIAPELEGFGGIVALLRFRLPLG